MDQSLMTPDSAAVAYAAISELLPAPPTRCSRVYCVQLQQVFVFLLSFYYYSQKGTEAIARD
jgi:hypothetical protein